jgi:Glucosidase II beta subunit-like protein
VGDIVPELERNGDMKFSGGDLCKIDGWRDLPREGTIHVQCGCDAAITEFKEVAQCKYHMVVSHPKACTETPICTKMTLREALREHKLQALEVEPSEDMLGQYPRNLLLPRYLK